MASELAMTMSMGAPMNMLEAIVNRCSLKLPRKMALEHRIHIILTSLETLYLVTILLLLSNFVRFCNNLTYSKSNWKQLIKFICKIDKRFMNKKYICYSVCHFELLVFYIIPKSTVNLFSNAYKFFSNL